MDGRVYGERGALTVEGGLLRCHACGGRYRNLGNHALRAHGITHAAYRERYGLPPDANLKQPPVLTREREPRPGEWAGPVYGEIGVLEDDGERVRCHACGGYYHALGPHVRSAHNLLPGEYRALFGLNRLQPLAGPALRRTRSETSAPHLEPYRGGASAERLREAEEQRLGAVAGRPMREQTRREARESPKRREAAERARREYAEGLRTPYADPAHLAAIRPKALEARREKLKVPEYRTELGRRISEAQGGRVLQACEVCGEETERTRSRAARTRTCGRSACRGELQRRRNLVREAEKREGLARRLRALGPGALDGLAPAERELVGAYYGLGGPVTEASAAEREAAIAPSLGLSPAWAAKVRRRAALRLLSKGRSDGASPEA